MAELMTMNSVASIASYESMCLSIAESDNRAECLDIADKSAALAEFARRIKNTDAERRAANIRLVAERRYGELLKDLARSTPGQAAAAGGHAKAGNVPPATVAGGSPYREAIERDQISERSAQRYQALADVPRPIFDQALADTENKPSARTIVERARAPQPQMPDDSLWIWGRMRDFERESFSAKNPAALLEAMTETMRADVVRIAPLMAEFFNRIQEVSHEPA